MSKRDVEDALPPRRKSLIDLSRKLGVINSSDALPSGFDMDIERPLEQEVHISPRIHSVHHNPPPSHQNSSLEQIISCTDTHLIPTEARKVEDTVVEQENHPFGSYAEPNGRMYSDLDLNNRLNGDHINLQSHTDHATSQETPQDSQLTIAPPSNSIEHLPNGTYNNNQELPEHKDPEHQDVAVGQGNSRQVSNASPLIPSSSPSPPLKVTETQDSSRTLSPIFAATPDQSTTPLQQKEFEDAQQSRLADRFAHLSATQSYSQTTPLPSTSTSIKSNLPVASKAAASVVPPVPAASRHTATNSLPASPKPQTSSPYSDTRETPAILVPLTGAISFFSKLFTPSSSNTSITSSSSHSNTPIHLNTHPRIAGTRSASTDEKDSIATASSSSSVPDALPSRRSHDHSKPSSEKLRSNRLSTRPLTLPPKSQQEESRHLEEYRQMMAAFEAKEAAQRQAAEEKQKAKDQRITTSRQTWTSEILPQWEKRKKTRQVYDMIWQGVPSFVRPKVWPLMIGNELHVTKELFGIYVKQAETVKTLRAAGQLKADSMGKLETASLIGVDLPRTFPALAFYQAGGPNHDELHRVLDAYVCYRPDIGYVQGMSYMAAILLLYLDEYGAFSCLANLLNRNIQLSFYKMDVELQQYVSLFETLFKRTLPELFDHFEEIGLTPDMYLLDWFLTVFSKSLPLDVATHLWDIYILEGESFLFKASLGILKYAQSKILPNQLDLAHSKVILVRLPEEDLDENALISSIASVSLKEHESILSQMQISLYHL